MATKPPRASKPPSVKRAPTAPADVAPFGGVASGLPPVVAPPPKPVWDPSNEAHVEFVFNGLAGGETMPALVALFDKCSIFILLRWLDSSDELKQAYVRARDMRAHVIAGRIYEMADEVKRGKIAPDAARVAIDAYKWTASKMLPKSYGDKVDISGSLNVSMVQALQELAMIEVPPTPKLPE